MPKFRTQIETFLFRIIGLASLVFLFIASRITLLPGLPSWYDEQRFLELLILSGALLLFGISPRLTTPLWTTFLWVGMLLLSMLSPMPGWAIAEFGIFMGLVALTFCIYQALHAFNQHHSKIMIFVLVIYALQIGFVPLAQLEPLLLGGATDLNLPTLFGGFSNHRFFSQTESLLIPLMALPAMQLTETSRWRKLSDVAACLLWLLAFAAGTRAFYVAIVVSVVFAWFYSDTLGRRWVHLQAWFAGFGGLAYGLLFKVLPWFLPLTVTTDNARLTTLETAADSSGRLDMWIYAVKLIFEHPLTGIGPMHFATLAATSPLTPGFAAHPHNSVLQLLVEWGLPMGLILLALMGLGIQKVFKAAQSPSNHPDASNTLFCLGMALLTAFVYSLFDGSLVNPYTQVLICVVAGWAWSAMAQSDEPSSNHVSASWLIKSNLVLTKVTAIAIGTYLCWMAITVQTTLTSYLTTHPDQALLPRLWSQGLIGFPNDDRYPDASFYPQK